MAKQVFLETIRGNLVLLCRVRQSSNPRKYTAQVRRGGFGYKKGETITYHMRNFVTKAKPINGHAYVTPFTIPT